jgi:xanthine dehydrogenase accessory factor
LGVSQGSQSLGGGQMIPIHKEIKRVKQNQLRGVLGTIISTEGSTYQKPGAKCFISSDGTLTGLLSGGCVESDLIEHAFKVLESGVPQTLHYNFQDDGDIVWGLGLGCNGKMNIFLEPYESEMNPASHIIEEFFTTSLTKQICQLIVVEANNRHLIGTRWLLDPQNGQEELLNIQYPEITNYFSQNHIPLKPGVTFVGGEHQLHIYTEITTPPPNLTIFGAGPDAMPLVRIAKQLNWYVTLVDHRAAYANTALFPDVDEIIVYAKDQYPPVTITSQSYVVLMTHHFLQDQMLLEGLHQSDAAYIGLLGPRKRTEELISTSDKLKHDDDFSHIHSPIGLDIGSKTPEEIALSILAEITLIHRGGSGLKLTELKGDLSLSQKRSVMNY